jgi:phage baseplate assembly protein gpV
MERFLNALKAQSAAQDRSTGQPRFAIVSSVDPTRPAARVLLQPEGVLTGWLPILSPWVGAGWGLSSPPSPGDQVLVLPQEGQSEHGVIIGRAWSDTARTPAAAAGELWLVHQSGAFLKLSNDGMIHLQGNTTLAGNLTVTGTISATGDIADGQGALSRLRGHYDAHTHIDSRGGVTSTTSQPD